MGESRYYAIGQRGWVELREATSRPTPETTQFTRKVSAKLPYIDSYGDTRYRKTTKPMIFKLTTYTGGKILTTVKPDIVARITGRWVEEDECWMIPKEYTKGIADLVAEID